MNLLFHLYRGAFKQLVSLHRGTFAGLFSKNPPNARESAGGGGGGGWALLEMTDALLKKIHYLTGKFHVKFHWKTDITLIASQLVSYLFF